MAQAGPLVPFLVLKSSQASGRGRPKAAMATQFKDFRQFWAVRPARSCYIPAQTQLEEQGDGDPSAFSPVFGGRP
jgi:hypothetical protein